MTLTQDKITRLKKLAGLSGQKEINIETVLESFEALRDISLPSEISVTRSGQGTLLPRLDRVLSSSPMSADDLLACSRQRVVAHQIVLGSIMHGE